ncbi:hypothetical protein [Paucibacter sp. B51]|uniref:hypothetical protein n=1 Tax=Paucibacter sp. B51 TaxID=2993315 RepID=UPI0022EBEF3D|nr:hypothetical protein [Paucibacter sp. B51]
MLRATDGALDSIEVSAPVTIDSVDDVVTVLVHRVTKTQRMNLHSATTKESLLNRRVSGADAEASERSGSSNSEGVPIVLRQPRRKAPCNFIQYKPAPLHHTRAHAEQAQTQPQCWLHSDMRRQDETR